MFLKESFIKFLKLKEFLIILFPRKTFLYCGHNDGEENFNRNLSSSKADLSRHVVDVARSNYGAYRNKICQY